MCDPSPGYVPPAFTQSWDPYATAALDFDAQPCLPLAHANCSSEITNCMPALPAQPRCMRLSTQAHQYAVQTPPAKLCRYLRFFITPTGKLYNSRPVFPHSYNFHAFRRGVSRNPVNVFFIMIWTSCLDTLFHLSVCLLRSWLRFLFDCFVLELHCLMHKKDPVVGNSKLPPDTGQV